MTGSFKKNGVAESNKLEYFPMKIEYKYFLRTSWTILITGFFVISGYGFFKILIDPSLATIIKIGGAMFYAGLLCLFLIVLRQRLKERKTDKYKDVEI